MHLGSLLAALCLALLAITVSSDSHSRKLFIRDIPNAGDKCSNTMQGLRLIADSKGMVCARTEVDHNTGCCKTGAGAQHTCDKCSLSDKCCAEYEHCVSCCLAPQHEAEKYFSATLKSPKHPAAGPWGSAWAYCAGLCRTHGRSTVHENAYISHRHHCFSQLGKPMLSEPLAAGALDGVEVAMSDSGESCEAACAKRGGKRCAADKLALLNTCDRLREKVGCEAGCEVGKVAGGSTPGYMDAGAPKASRPAMCFTTADVAALSCGGKDQHVRRLCACS